MEQITIQEFNSVFDRIITEPSIRMEISETFSFYPQNYKFNPKFKSGAWDGRIRLYNTKTQKIYAGMRHHIIDFANERNYKVTYEGNVNADDVSVQELMDFIKSLDLPEDRTPYDYQIKGILTSLRQKRSLMISPTSSGKSLMAYIIQAWYNKKTLLIVPTVSLVEQMVSDFASYGMDVSDCHKIFQGQEKRSNKRVIVSTWQSVFEMPESWFDQFDVIIGDEAHTFNANSLKIIMENLKQCDYRFGMTGTLDGSTIHQWTLEGLFGKMINVISTKELQESGRAANIKIKCVNLVYDDVTKKAHKKDNYQQELDFLVSNEKRNKFIRNLSVSLDGNSLLLFQFVDKQGKVIYDMLKEKYPDRHIFMVYGDIDAKERERIRQFAENNTNTIIVASYGTFSTGINIKNLHNIVFCSPSKSRIRILQSIGRGLRLHETKDHMTLIDISDDLTWKSHVNVTYKHFEIRLQLYNNQGFPYKIYRIDI